MPTASTVSAVSPLLVAGWLDSSFEWWILELVSSYSFLLSIPHMCGLHILPWLFPVIVYRSSHTGISSTCCRPAWYICSWLLPFHPIIWKRWLRYVHVWGDCVTVYTELGMSLILMMTLINMLNMSVGMTMVSSKAAKVIPPPKRFLNILNPFTRFHVSFILSQSSSSYGSEYLWNMPLGLMTKVEVHRSHCSYGNWSSERKHWIRTLLILTQSIQGFLFNCWVSESWCSVMVVHYLRRRFFSPWWTGCALKALFLACIDSMLAETTNVNQLRIL